MITVIHGKNAFANKQLKDKIIHDYLAETGSDFGLEQFDAGALEPKRLREVLTAMPFLASNKLLIINQPSKQAEVIEKILELAGEVPDTTHLVIYEHELDNRSKFAKALKSNKTFTVHKHDGLDEAAATKWLVRQAIEHGGELDSRTAQLIVQRVGTDQWVLHNELQKLLSHGKQITRESVLALTEPSIEDNIFKLTDAMSAGDISEVLAIYRDLRRARMEPMYLFTMISWQLHNLLVIKSAGSRTVQQIASDAKMAPFVVSKTQGIVRVIQIDNLEQAINLAVEADLKLKSRSLDADHVIEDLLIQLTQLLKSNT